MYLHEEESLIVWSEDELEYMPFQNSCYLFLPSLHVHTALHIRRWSSLPFFLNLVWLCSFFAQQNSGKMKVSVLDVAFKRIDSFCFLSLEVSQHVKKSVWRPCLCEEVRHSQKLHDKRETPLPGWCDLVFEHRPTNQEVVVWFLIRAHDHAAGSISRREHTEGSRLMILLYLWCFYSSSSSLWKLKKNKRETPVNSLFFLPS